jgi:hypothetical protein
MADQDLSTLATLKGWLPIKTSETADDATLTRLLTAVSMDFQRAVNRPDLLQADYMEVHPGDGAEHLVTFHWPIVAVTTLTIGSATIAASADKIAAGYYFDADIDPERRWQIYLNGYLFADNKPVKLAYSAGYAQPGVTLTAGQIALPLDIEQAVLDWCAYRYKERPNVAIAQRRTAQGQEEQTELLDAPPNVLQVIERYKRELPSLDRRAEERAERLAKPSFKPQRRK